MNPTHWLQLGLYLGLLLALTGPCGRYLLRVLDPKFAGGGTFLDRWLGPLERLIYRWLRVDPEREQNWRSYTFALLTFTFVTWLLTYAGLRLQHLLPLNPKGLPGVPGALAFNTATSFATNTNWQSYSGETTLSILSQMLALTSQNFFSAAAGIAVAAALVRGIAGNRSAAVGNFWVDLVRVHLYLLLPACLVYALFLASQGVVQTFRAEAVVHVLDQGGSGSPARQTIALGPLASQVAIKMLGTNGGGYMNANAAHPFENPSPLTNFVQMLSILLLPSGLTAYLGLRVRSPAHGWAVWSAMAAMFLAGAIACATVELGGNARVAELGVDRATSSLEGKEVRFGAFNSALFATITTDASCGAVNSMHDSFTPLGGLVPLFNIMTGEVIFGGVGAGLYGMLIFVTLAIFIAGLMIGRTPEYLGKKIDAGDVKLAVLALLGPSLCILGLAAWAATQSWGVAGLNNGGPHGLSEILYAYSSAAGNNGSAFAGLTCTPADGDMHYNLSLGVAMFAGRFLVIVPLLALAGRLGKKQLLPQGPGTFPVGGPTFAVLLVGTVVLVGALTFLPALAFGPILEHFLLGGASITF